MSDNRYMTNRYSAITPDGRIFVAWETTEAKARHYFEGVMHYQPLRLIDSSGRTIASR